MVAAGLIGVRNAHRGGYAHVGGGGDLQTRFDGHLVRLFLGVVCNQRVRFNTNFPTIPGLYPS